MTARPPGGRPLVVLIGPQTRLARALLTSTAWEHDPALVLVARDHEEYEVVQQAEPGAIIFRAWEREAALPQGGDSIAVVCCAFGVIHPRPPAADDDFHRAGADRRVLETILRRYPSSSLHLVLISSVLALCPGRGREYYAGWKNVTEALIRQLAARHRRACLSVLYPGRLVEAKQLRQPSSLLSTTYPRLADMVVSMVRQRRARNTVVGVDARVWLVVRCLRLAGAALIGRR